MSPYNRCSKKWRPFGHRIPIDLDLGKEIDPHTPEIRDGGIRYADDEMGLPPSKYPPKNQKMSFRSKNGGPKRKIGVYKK